MNAKLSNVISKEGYRPVLNYAMFNKDHVYATNAHILVIHKAKELFCEQFYNSIPETGNYLLSKDALKAMERKHDTCFIEDGMIKVIVKGAVTAFPLIAEEDQGTFPNCESVMPNDTKPYSTENVGVTPKYLFDAMKGIDSDLLVIEMVFTGDHRAILLKHRSTIHPSSRAIIMPVATME